MGDVRTSVRIIGINPDGEPSDSDWIALEKVLVDTGASQTIVSAAVAALTGLVELPIKTTLRGVWGRLEARQAIAAMVVPHCEPQVIVVAISDDVLDRVGVKNMIIGHDYLQRAEIAVLMGSLELRPEV